MASGLGETEEDITGINVTPLVDVMLVLLIIFMVTANYIAHQSIALKLPKAEIADNVERSKNLAFVLDSGGRLFLNGQPLSFEQVPEKIEEERRTGQADTGGAVTLNALISADKDTAHGTVVKLIDAVRKHGITDFAIDIERGTPE